MEEVFLEEIIIDFLNQLLEELLSNSVYVNFLKNFCWWFVCKKGCKDLTKIMETSTKQVIRDIAKFVVSFQERRPGWFPWTDKLQKTMERSTLYFMEVLFKKHQPIVLKINNFFIL